MARRRWTGIGSFAMVVALIGALGAPAGADYAPFILLDPTQGPVGSEIAIDPDRSGGWCAETTFDEQGVVIGQTGTVLVELGTLANPPDIGSPVQLDEVLASTTVDAGSDGFWSATLTVPDVPNGQQLYITGHCDVDGSRLFDYYPASFTVGEQVTTSTPTTSTTATSVPVTTPPADAAPAEAVSGQADFTG